MEGKIKLKGQLEIIEKEEKVGSSDKLAISKIVKYLLTRDDMNQKYLSGEKTLEQMWEFIRNEAKTKAVNGCAVLDDEEVYSIAIHYFDETNEALGIKTTKKAEKQDAKTEKDACNTKQDADVQDKKQEKKPKYNDNDIVMKYKGRLVTYKEFKDGVYLQLL